MTEAPRLSGFCATPPGINNHTYACTVCERRQADGLLQPCDCPGHRKEDS